MPRVEANLARLREAFPKIRVVSVNLQPVHMARLEGDEEIFLTEDEHLIELFNDVPLVVQLGELAPNTLSIPAVIQKR